MPILNRERIREDVLKIFDESTRLQARALYKFMRQNKASEGDLKELWKRVMRANRQFFLIDKSMVNLKNIINDKEALFLAKMHRFLFEFSATMTQKKHPSLEDIEIEQDHIKNVSVEWQVPNDSSDDNVFLYFHGGGYIMGSPNTHRLLTVGLAKATGMRVLSVDYRLAPENTYPAPLEDAISVYKGLLDIGIENKNIVISGDSAGGHLILSTLIKLKQEKLALPAGAIPISPLTDTTLSGESFLTNVETDPILADVGVFWWLEKLAGSLNLKDPLISPLFADYSGLPPLLFQASKSEILFSDSVRCVEKARKDGVQATLQAWDGMPHVFQLFGIDGLPEASEAISNITEFVKTIIK